MTDLPAYAELHCISNYSFLRGASSPEELVERALQLGYRGLALTDDCSVGGIVRAHVAARQQPDFKLITGSEFSLPTGTDSSEPDCLLVMLATSRLAYGELSHLITSARIDSPKGAYRLDRALLEANRPAECLVLWVPDLSLQPANLALQGQWLSRLFPDRLWIAVELLLRGDDRSKLQRLQALGKQHRIPLCAAGGVYMHEPERRAVQDTLTAIRLNRPLSELGLAAEPNGQRHLRPREQLARLYPAQLLSASAAIAERCNFSPDELRYEYPAEVVPEHHTAFSYLRKVTEEGIRQRWPLGISAKNRKIVDHELMLIKKLRYEHFFLTVHDIVRFARDNNIYCQGRGSAANSVVCYCLGITEANPDHTQMLFERFVSAERKEPPDIDVDFEHTRRNEVIAYLYRKYGRQRTAIAAAVICYRPKSAIRDVGKALGMDAGLIDLLARSLCWWKSGLKEQIRDSGVNFEDPQIQQLLYLTDEIVGFPRHLSQHVGGFVISAGPLSRLVPVENAAMPERTVIQWNKDDLEALGLLKVDVLALGMLTAIHKAMDLVNDYSGQQYTMQSIPREDSQVYDMICKADTVGVFQIESRAQMSMLPRLQPRTYYDLVIQIAIVRPGPIEGGMVHPYLQRRKNPAMVHYENEAMKQVLSPTLGVPIFQEQVMQIAMVGAGFTPGEADQLRRSMAAWKKRGGLEPFRDRLMSGLLRNGYLEDFARQICRQVQGFGEYGFPESHSASFAHIAYISAWLKCHHPAAFCCALLNSQPMGFYAPAQLIRDARRHQIEVLPADVNSSYCDCTLEYDGTARANSGSPFLPALRIGFNQIKNLSVTGMGAIEESRQETPFSSVRDLVYRSGISQRDLEALAAADALRGLSGDRHQAFWQASDTEMFCSASEPMNFCRHFTADNDFGADVMLPKPGKGQDIFHDYQTLGFSLREHPMSLFRQHLNSYSVTPAGRLAATKPQQQVKVAGLVTSRQRPQTASGVVFITIEDETGCVNAVVWPRLAEASGQTIRLARLMGVAGHVQHSDGVIHLVASHLVDLSSWLGSMRLPSRDFM